MTNPHRSLFHIPRLQTAPYSSRASCCRNPSLHMEEIAGIPPRPFPPLPARLLLYLHRLYSWHSFFFSCRFLSLFPSKGTGSPPRCLSLCFFLALVPHFLALLSRFFSLFLPLPSVSVSFVFGFIALLVQFPLVFTPELPLHTLRDVACLLIRWPPFSCLLFFFWVGICQRRSISASPPFALTRVPSTS